MVLALAGRRVDPVNAATPRFPLANVDTVRARVRALLTTHKITAVVCSAACGADLVALDEAASLGLRCRIVLAFSRPKFRDASVTDRPGDWGPLYDRLLDRAEAAGDVVVIKEMPEDEVFTATNLLILDEAEKLAHQTHQKPAAALVWDGTSRGSDDITAHFGEEARRRGWHVYEVRTLDQVRTSGA